MRRRQGTPANLQITPRGCESHVQRSCQSRWLLAFVPSQRSCQDFRTDVKLGYEFLLPTNSCFFMSVVAGPHVAAISWISGCIVLGNIVLHAPLMLCHPVDKNDDGFKKIKARLLFKQIHTIPDPRGDIL